MLLWKPMEKQLEYLRHSLAHLLAAAVMDIYPDTKRTIGPAIDNGFYFDFEFSKPISENDLPKIEKKMREILKGWDGFERTELTADEARAEYPGNEYKHELIDEFTKDGSKVSFYKSGGYSDLCRGGHVESAKEIRSDCFKLDRIAGAYWRGEEKNKMLTRIYGLAFESKEKLDAYILQQEEAKKRDHRKIGKELKLFTTSDLIGAGLPLMQPKGMLIRKAIEDYLWDLHRNKGYWRVWTPHIAKEALYETSGHAEKFGDELFRVSGKEEKFIMKPMNCPHHMQIFADNQFSYRDMPVRYFEPATVYRDEKSGQLGGLTRVRAITQDDGHLFCRDNQINFEVSTIVNIIKEFYTTMNMMDGYWVRLSTRGEDKDKFIGSDDIWGTAEWALRDAAEANKLNLVEGPGEAAFYGPKLDFMFKDAIGREWQLATIQCDFNLPERFDLSFVNENGQKERPVVIHRAISGSLERFMGVLIEHYAGAFPLWLSPVQVKVLPISEKHLEYAKIVADKLNSLDIRVELDESNESLGKKIRNAKTEKIPYLLVIGDKEAESNTVTIEHREAGNQGATSVDELLARLSLEIKEKK